MNIVDRAKARIGQLKADRATVAGIAGHQAAMKALGANEALINKNKRPAKDNK
jgi:hypothetical protein